MFLSITEETSTTKTISHINSLPEVFGLFLNYIPFERNSQRLPEPFFTELRPLTPVRAGHLSTSGCPAFASPVSTKHTSQTGLSSQVLLLTVSDGNVTQAGLCGHAGHEEVPRHSCETQQGAHYKPFYQTKCARLQKLQLMNSSFTLGMRNKLH